MRYKIVEVELAIKTVNRTDPTTISKKIGENVVDESNTFEDIQKKLEKIEEEETECFNMSLAMCDGDSTLMGPQPAVERYVFDTIEQKVFQLGFVDTGVEEIEGCNMPTCKSLLMPIKDITSISELYVEGWVM